MQGSPNGFLSSSSSLNYPFVRRQESFEHKDDDLETSLLFDDVLGLAPNTSQLLDDIAEYKQTIDKLRYELNQRMVSTPIFNLSQLATSFAKGLQESLKMNATNADVFDIPKLKAYTNSSFLSRQNTNSDTTGS